MTYELHPLCTLFPRMSDAEFASLCDDIRANGQREPIMLLNDMVLDGGNRYRACLEVGAEPFFEPFTGSNPVAYVLSVNLHRRHLSPGQQAAIVASMQDWSKADSAGGARRGDQPATLRNENVAARMALSGASERTQQMADRVAKADPDLAKQVGRGEVSLPAAVAKVMGKTPTKSKPKAKAAPAADQPATLRNDASGKGCEAAASDGPTLPELVDELQRENEALNGQLAAIGSDDPRAEALKWRKAYDHSVRQQSEAMERAAESTKREAWVMRQLMRCGKAVGEDDPTKIAAAVEGAIRKQAGKVAA